MAMSSSTSRRARALKSHLRRLPAELVAVEGPLRWAVALVLAGAVAFCGRVVYLDIAARASPLVDATWPAFGRVVGVWFALNVALCLLLGVVDAAVPGADRHADRFAAYPLFSWLTPGSQQLLFFAPAAAYLVAAWAHQVSHGGACAARPAFEGALAAHAGPSLAGMQLRELLLFESDAAMTAHHVTTSLLSGLAWRALTREPDDCEWALATCGALAAMEAGSLGCVAWAVLGGGTRWRTRFYVGSMTLSHFLVLVAGFAGHVRKRPGNWEGWVVCGATLPLMYARHAYMVAEVKAGTASGTFVDDKKTD